MTCLISFHLFSQKGIPVDNGALSSSLGGIITVIKGDDALLNNFSFFTESSGFTSVLSSSRRFNLSELQSLSFGLAAPISTIGHVGLTFSQYGFDLYKESSLNLHYARKLSGNLSISGMLGANSLQIEENGSTINIGYRLSAAGRISNDLSYGVVVSNLEKISRAENTSIVSQIAFGLNYKVSAKTSISTEIEKELEEDLSFKTGISYHLHSSLSIMAGYNSNPGQTSAGFSWKILSVLELQSAFSYHSLLGLTPVLTLKYRSSQNEDLKR